MSHNSPDARPSNIVSMFDQKPQVKQKPKLVQLIDSIVDNRDKLRNLTAEMGATLALNSDRGILHVRQFSDPNLTVHGHLDDGSGELGLQEIIQYWLGRLHEIDAEYTALAEECARNTHG